MASPAQRSTTTGAILFGVANRVHIHLKPTSMCGINVVGGGGGFFATCLVQIIIPRAISVVEMMTRAWHGITIESWRVVVCAPVLQSLSAGTHSCCGNGRLMISSKHFCKRWFLFSQTALVEINEDFLQYIMSDCLSVEVWGHRSSGFGEGQQGQPGMELFVPHDPLTASGSSRTKTLGERWEVWQRTY